MDKELIKQIKSELRFLNSEGIRDLVHEADIGASHYPSVHIEKRKEKLDKKIAELTEVNPK